MFFIYKIGSECKNIIMSIYVHPVHIAYKTSNYVQTSYNNVMDMENNTDAVNYIDSN